MIATYAVALSNAAVPAVIALVLCLYLCFVIFARRAKITKHKQKEKERCERSVTGTACVLMHDT
jgi:hypothetical protein